MLILTFEIFIEDFLQHLFLMISIPLLEKGLAQGNSSLSFLRNLSPSSFVKHKTFFAVSFSFSTSLNNSKKGRAYILFPPDRMIENVQNIYIKTCFIILNSNIENHV